MIGVPQREGRLVCLQRRRGTYVMTILFAVFIAALIVLFYSWYVVLIRRRNRALEALSSIDVQLRKRHDLLPNILKLAERFMTHERELLTRVTELRNAARESYDVTNPEAVRRHLEAEGGLQVGMRQLFALAENYPDLRSSETITEAQQTFALVEGHISAARRFYNSAVTDLNNAVQIFPGSLIARQVGVQTLPFFELKDDSLRQAVDVSDYLGER